MEWDMALSSQGRYVVLRIPVEIGSALVERGFTRAKVTVTDAGILLVPYVSDRSGPGRTTSPSVELPEWGK